ncbi:hypothetical protein B0H19DRAFT_1133998 [Mycena capillaripes]|nr:hypothetical protein B0H19DRAFT_1133998 [Mycena capillaripes]
MFGIRSLIIQAFKSQIPFKSSADALLVPPHCKTVVLLSTRSQFPHLLAEPAYMEGAARRETVCARQLPWVLLILFILYSMLMIRSDLYRIVQANATTMIYYFIGMGQFYSMCPPS